MDDSYFVSLYLESANTKGGTAGYSAGCEPLSIVTAIRKGQRRIHNSTYYKLTLFIYYAFTNI